MGSQVLEVDSSLLERKLRIQAIDQEEDEFNKLFNGINMSKEKSGVTDGIPWKLVTPNPGLCLKFFTCDGDKNFVNICHTKEIPPPKDITDQELLEILDSDDPSSYRIPMSISDPHTEADKAGNLTKAYDVAVHSSLIHKIENNKVFKLFFITAMLEALQEKYKIKVNMTLETQYVVLKNRKSIGSLRPHRIQQRSVRPPPGPLIQEVKSPASPESDSARPLDPKLKLELYPAQGKPDHLIARVKMRAFSEQDIRLDVGEDRLILTAVKKNHSFVDIYLPCNVDQDKVSAQYSRLNKELVIKMPVLN